MDDTMEVQLEQIEIKDKVTFLDYIYGGCEIGLEIAVDFNLHDDVKE
jgi:hypothetical protein